MATLTEENRKLSLGNNSLRRKLKMKAMKAGAGMEWKRKHDVIVRRHSALVRENDDMRKSILRWRNKFNDELESRREIACELARLEDKMASMRRCAWDGVGEKKEEVKGDVEGGLDGSAEFSFWGKKYEAVERGKGGGGRYEREGLSSPREGLYEEGEENGDEDDDEECELEGGGGVSPSSSRGGLTSPAATLGVFSGIDNDDEEDGGEDEGGQGGRGGKSKNHGGEGVGEQDRRRGVVSPLPLDIDGGAAAGGKGDGGLTPVRAGEVSGASEASVRRVVSYSGGRCAAVASLQPSFAPHPISPLR